MKVTTTINGHETTIIPVHKTEKISALRREHDIGFGGATFIEAEEFDGFEETIKALEEAGVNTDDLKGFLEII